MFQLMELTNSIFLPRIDKIVYGHSIDAPVSSFTASLTHVYTKPSWEAHILDIQKRHDSCSNMNHDKIIFGVVFSSFPCTNILQHLVILISILSLQKVCKRSQALVGLNVHERFGVFYIVRLLRLL